MLQRVADTALTDNSGADACILVYSCENRQSYTSLERWFHSFVDKCPLLDGEERTFPFVCVGNKHDLVRSSDTANLVDEKEVKALLGRLLPTLGGGDTVKKEAPPSSVPSAFRNHPSAISQIR